MDSLILDTGPLVALLDASERNHEPCKSIFRSFKGALLTTEPVLTEALYLLNGSIRAQHACIEFVVKAATLVPQSPDSLARAAFLMEKYRDIPMDFADATLVALAEETGINAVFTLDRRGFGAFRLHGRKAFAIKP